MECLSYRQGSRVLGEREAMTSSESKLSESNLPAHPSLEHPTLSSQFLLGVQRMEPALWSRLVTTFGPIVYRWCRTSGVRDADAPDVVQDVFAAVARGIVSFERERSQGSFRSWLATITRNKVRDYFRALSKRPIGEGGSEAWGQLQNIPQDLDSTICADNATQPLIREVLAQVEAEFEKMTWKAFWLTTVEGANAKDVAGQLGISTASVYQAKSRVLRRLRQRLAELPQ
jgi:RNA polymerase sigma-70 factor, ECF subfamily